MGVTRGRIPVPWHNTATPLRPLMNKANISQYKMPSHKLVMYKHVLCKKNKKHMASTCNHTTSLPWHNNYPLLHHSSLTSTGLIEHYNENTCFEKLWCQWIFLCDPIPQQPSHTYTTTVSHTTGMAPRYRGCKFGTARLTFYRICSDRASLYVPPYTHSLWQGATTEDWGLRQYVCTTATHYGVDTTHYSLTHCTKAKFYRICSVQRPLRLGWCSMTVCMYLITHS